MGSETNVHFGEVQRHEIMQAVRLPSGYWKNIHNQRSLFDRVGNQLGVTNTDDWYHIKTEDVVQQGGLSVIKTYQGSLAKALINIYPEYDWKLWKFDHKPKSLMKDTASHRPFLDELEKSLNITNKEQWYNISKEQILQHGGEKLLRTFDDSKIKLLTSIYKEVPWEISKFDNTAKNFWTNISNQRSFLDSIGKQLGVQQMEDWYHIHASQVAEKGGFGLLNHHNSSLIHALQAIYPEYDWKVWLFSVTPRHFWETPSNHRLFFDWLGKELGITNTEGWYHVRTSEVAQRGGGGLLQNYYNASLYRALSTIYPEQKWMPWRFEKIPHGYWNTKENVVFFLKWFAELLNISKLNDWYHVSREDFVSAGASTLFDKYGSLLSLLQEYYPEHDWSQSKMGKIVSKGQAMMFRLLQDIFPDTEIIMNYVHPNIVFPVTSGRMEFDVFIPKHQLALEFQGQHHYSWTPLYGDPFLQQQRDQMKRTICKEAGITIVDVPFWWDRKKGSLMATLSSVRPELVTAPPGAKPISTELPKRFAKFPKPVEHLAKIAKVLKIEASTQETTLLCESTDSRTFSLVLKKEVVPLDVTVGSVIHFTTSGTSSVVTQVEEESRWLSIQASSNVPFEIRKGNPSGSFPHCKGCKKTFSDRNMLRLQVKGSFTPLHSQTPQPIPVRFNLCLNQDCLKEAVKKLTSPKKHASSVWLPTFQNKILVPKELAANPQLQDAQSKFPKTEWIVA